MKVLHIGKAGNMEKYSAGNALYESMEKVDMYMGLPTEDYLNAAADADFLVVDAVAEVSAELIRCMPNLKLIHSEGVAYNRIDVEAAHACGVYVCNSRGMNASAVAEQAILLMLGLLRNVCGGDHAVREARQITMKEGYMQRGDLYELADLSIGLVGFGDIARSLARLLKAFGVQSIYYYKRHRLSAEEEKAYGVTYLDLSQLLAQSDMVSIHIPVTPNTIGMCNDEFFAQMKSGSWFVNTARGEIVDDAALIRALESGKLAGIGLDTLSHEPVQPDHPLIRLETDIANKILFSPHVGGITASSFKRSYAMVWEDIQAVLDGKMPIRAV